MIYGYDSDNDIVYLADHFKNGKYSFDTCSFGELALSLCLNNFDFEKRFERVYSRITLMKYDSSFYKNPVKLYYDYDKRILFNVDICRKSLQSYLLGVPIRNWHTRLIHMSKEEESKHYFGIRCYELILKQIDITWKEKCLFSGIIQSVYVVYSHKLMMCKRIEYMMNKGLLENGEYHYGVWNELTMQAKIVLWFLVKCDAAKNYDISSKEKLYRRIESIKQNEIREIEKFLIDIHS